MKGYEWLLGFLIGTIVGMLLVIVLWWGRGGISRDEAIDATCQVLVEAKLVLSCGGRSEAEDSDYRPQVLLYAVAQNGHS